MSGILEHVVFCDWLLSLNMFSRFICVEYFILFIVEYSIV